MVDASLPTVSLVALLTILAIQKLHVAVERFNQLRIAHSCTQLSANNGERTQPLPTADRGRYRGQNLMRTTINLLVVVHIIGRVVPEPILVLSSLGSGDSLSLSAVNETLVNLLRLIQRRLPHGIPPCGVLFFFPDIPDFLTMQNIIHTLRKSGL